jgi:hypothetical protein
MRLVRRGLPSGRARCQATLIRQRPAVTRDALAGDDQRLPGSLPE